MNRQQRQILFSALASLLAAALLLFTMVLPAEFNLDPLGTGARLGLLGMSQPEATALTQHSQPLTRHSIEFTLAPFESVEYKYELNAGASLVYEWRAEQLLTFDMHGQYENSEEAITFTAGKALIDQGTFIAPFKGIHGWFFENRSMQPVTVTLSTSGFFTSGMEFRDGFTRQDKFAGWDDS